MKSNQLHSELTIPEYEPLTSIDEYLNTPADLQIYQDLQGLGEDAGILEYFNNLYHEVNIVFENLDRPIAIMNHLKRLDMCEEDRFHLLQDLFQTITFLPRYKQSEVKANIVLTLIEDEIMALGEIIAPEIYGDGTERAFRKIISKSAVHADLEKERIRLINVRAEFQQICILLGEDPDKDKLILLVDRQIERCTLSLSNIALKINHNKEKVSGIQDKPGKSVPEIVLSFIWRGEAIERGIKAQELAESYGFTSSTSGDHLSNQYNKYLKKSERVALPKGSTKRAFREKIMTFERAYNVLPPQFQSKPLEEIRQLKKLYETEFHEVYTEE